MNTVTRGGARGTALLQMREDFGDFAAGSVAAEGARLAKDESSLRLEE